MSTQAPATRSTVRLSDQALVGVHLARSLAGSRTPNVGHLVAGVVGEPEGRAGLRIRAASGESRAARLATHPGLAADLPTLASALIALPVDVGVSWTDDVITAACRVGGEELDDLLSDAGITVPDNFPLRSRPGPEDVQEGEETETFGRGTFVPRGFDDRADRAIALARAAGETSTQLLPWLELAPEVRGDYTNLPPIPIQEVIEHALDVRHDPPLGLSELASAILRISIRRLAGRPPGQRTD